MKNTKQLFCGIVIGVVAAVSVTALAEYIANSNAFPVKVNGRDAQLEGYNIEGSTYFKLRDVADAVGGFSVDFVDNTITIQTDNAAAPEAAPSPTYQPVANAKNTPNPKLPLYRYKGDEFNPNAHIDEYSFSSDGLVIETGEDGKSYIYTGDIETVYDFKANGYSFGIGCIYDSQYHRILDDITIEPDHSIHIELNYYETVMLPWLQANCG